MLGWVVEMVGVIGVGGGDGGVVVLCESGLIF